MFMKNCYSFMLWLKINPIFFLWDNVAEFGYTLQCLRTFCTNFIFILKHSAFVVIENGWFGGLHLKQISNILKEISIIPKCGTYVNLPRCMKFILWSAHDSKRSLYQRQGYFEFKISLKSSFFSACPLLSPIRKSIDNGFSDISSVWACTWTRRISFESKINIRNGPNQRHPRKMSQSSIYISQSQKTKKTINESNQNVETRISFAIIKRRTHIQKKLRKPNRIQNKCHFPLENWNTNETCRK